MRWRVLALPDGLETRIPRSPQMSEFPSASDCDSAPSVERIRLVICLPKVDCNPPARPTPSEDAELPTFSRASEIFFPPWSEPQQSQFGVGMVRKFCCQEVNELLKSRYKIVSRPTHLWISVASRSRCFACDAVAQHSNILHLPVMNNSAEDRT